MDYDAGELTTTTVDWRENVKDLAAGAAGGVAQVLIGELPFFHLHRAVIDFSTRPAIW